MKKVIIFLLSAFLLTIVILSTGFILVMRGAMPLVNGTELANGKVIIAADSFIASYLIKLESGEIALVDAGFDPEAETIKSSLSDNNFTPEDVVSILLTHGHGDHIAGALSFPDADLYALEPDVDLIEGRRVADSPFARKREIKSTGLVVKNSLQDADVFMIGGTRVEVFAVPGHTRGSAAYLIDGILFIGDSAAATSNGKISGAPPVFSANLDENREALITLIERLAPRQNEIKAVAFGHQGPIMGFQPFLNWAAERK